MRAAVRAAWGDEFAPVQLRKRIISALASEVDAAGSLRLRFLRSPLIGLAAAAAILLVVGTLAMQSKAAFVPAYQASATSIRSDVQYTLVTAHNAGSRMPRYLLVDGLDPAAEIDFEQMGSRLIAQVGTNVYAHAIGDGWRFNAAGISPIGEVNAAQLVFRRGDQAVSVFSLPKSVVYFAKQDARFNEVIDGQPLAGFVRGDSLICVVGSGQSLAPAEVQQIRDRIRQGMILSESWVTTDLDTGLTAQ